MNLIHGKIVDALESRKALEGLDASVLRTLSKGYLSTETVISACDKLSKSIGEGHLALLSELGIPLEQGREYLDEARIILGREHLEKRLERELGALWDRENSFIAGSGRLSVTERLRPLGAVLHITAGNQTGLACYSVIEGLLTGNINIVKLSGDDDGLSTLVLSELTGIEPALEDYVYVFDIPSSDKKAMERLVRPADAVTVWGGDGAVRAVRALVPAGIKIIEWGHKLSFAYATRGGVTEAALRGLAENIIGTNQLLCSSCQGVFLDTDSMEEVYAFCERFLPILDERRRSRGPDLSMEIRAQSTIKRYTRSLERPCRVFTGARTSITACEDSALEISVQHGNCWAKPLPRARLLSALRPYKGCLQTAALLCAEGELEALSETVFKAGAVRVTRGANMSRTYPEAAHDGVLSLSRYVKLVSTELPAGEKSP